MMRFPHVICLCLALLLGTAPTRADRPDQTAPVVGIRQQPPRTFALTAARVVAKPGEVLENATIVIEGSRIVAVGVADPIPPTARVLDMSGKTIYAGFIDAYGEQELPVPAAGPNYWNDHVTPQLRVVDHYDPNTKRNEQLRRQGIVACLMAPAKGLVKGISSVVATGTAPAVESIIRQEVGQHVGCRPNAAADAKHAIRALRWEPWRSCDKSFTTRIGIAAPRPGRMNIRASHGPRPIWRWRPS